MPAFFHNLRRRQIINIMARQPTLHIFGSHVDCAFATHRDETEALIPHTHTRRFCRIGRFKGYFYALVRAFFFILLLT